MRAQAACVLPFLTVLAGVAVAGMGIEGLVDKVTYTRSPPPRTAQEALDAELTRVMLQAQAYIFSEMLIIIGVAVCLLGLALVWATWPRQAQPATAASEPVAAEPPTTQ